MNWLKSAKAKSAGVLLAAFLVFTTVPAAGQDALNFGSSSVGSLFYVVSIGMSKLMGDFEGMNVTVQPLGGSYPNLFALASKKVDLVICNSLSVFDRYQGNTPFKETFEVRMIAQGFPNFRIIIVRKGAGINSPADLIGKTIVGKRRALPELVKITEALLRVHNIPADKVKVVDTVDTGQVAKALRAGTVDAAVYPSALRQPMSTSLFQDGIVDFLYLSPEKRDEMLKMLPAAFWKGTFPAGNFPGQKKDSHVFGLSTALATRADLSDEVVYKVTRAVLGHPEQFAKYHPSAREWTVKQSLSNPSVPYHNGTIRYFKEIGAWSAEMDAAQARLLKR
ncbi:MAG: TAXI family TRAP transporter solute-binding subunit [Pseudomonadota bacterium]